MKKNRKNATLDIVLERLSSLELAKIETKMEIAARIEDEMIRFITTLYFWLMEKQHIRPNYKNGWMMAGIIKNIFMRVFISEF